MRLKMRPRRTKKGRNHNYDEEMSELMENYTKILVCEADKNVQSWQLQRIRKALRHNSIVLMGRKTMIERSMFIHAEKTGNNSFLNLITGLKGNVGLVFTKGDLMEVQRKIDKYKIRAPARVGLIALVDVFLSPGNTGLDLFQTCFFQVLNIPTKIDKGKVEIVAHVELIRKGEKVGSSEAALLEKLGLKPFSYGLTVKSIYDHGSIFSPKVLNFKEDALAEKFHVAVSIASTLSLGIRYPTLAGASHMFANTWNYILPMSMERKKSFRLTDLINKQLEDPSRLPPLGSNFYNSLKSDFEANLWVQG